MATTEVKIEYPSSDGEPMAETTIHARAMVLLQEALEDFFRPRTDVFIPIDLFWYYDTKGSDAKVAPDVMVFLGIANHDRRKFEAWVENGAIPSIIIEVTSKDTKDDDEVDKYWLYEELGVQEYFLFDPEQHSKRTALQGYRLNGTAYRRLRPQNGIITSQFGFHLQPEGTMVRLTDATTGAKIPTRLEAIEAEKSRADKLQSEVERFQAMLQKFGHANGS
jgi:Uma2 family endonuclease